MKNCNDAIGNRAHKLLARREVPEPTLPSHAPTFVCTRCDFVTGSREKYTLFAVFVFVGDLDRSHGFIAPRPLCTGPLCPTLE
jgi:hypothetical protein